MATEKLRKEADLIFTANYDLNLAFLKNRLSSRNDVEDLLHDTYVRFIKALPEIRDVNKIPQFLRAVIRVTLKRAYRRKIADNPQLRVPYDDDLISTWPGTEARIDAVNQLNNQSNSLLERCSPKQQEAFHMWMDGFTFESIAKKQGVPYATVYSRVKRARDLISY